LQQFPTAGFETKGWNDIMRDEDQEPGIAQAPIIVISDTPRSWLKFQAASLIRRLLVWQIVVAHLFARSVDLDLTGVFSRLEAFVVGALQFKFQKYRSFLSQSDRQFKSTALQQNRWAIHIASVGSTTVAGERGGSGVCRM
jgi:hypothetical protein